MDKKNLTGMDVGLLTIGAAAKTLNLAQRTLRIWDTQGILVPERSEGDRRLYSLNDIEKGKFILFLTRNLALNLSGVNIIQSMRKDMKKKEKDYLPYISKIAQKANIDTKIQQVNIKKTGSKGRKPDKKS